VFYTLSFVDVDMATQTELAEVSSRYSDAINSELAADEGLLAVVVLYEDDIKRNRTRLCVTDRRLLTVKKGWIWSRSETVPLSKVTAVNRLERLAGVVEVTTHSGDENAYLMSKSDSKQIAATIRSAMDGQSDRSD
jgi:membrane protein YdbS with pleckstrin-like domain